MRAQPTQLPGPLLIEPVVHRNDRGFFVESYRRSVMQELGVVAELVQHNHSRSGRGVVRGMRFQPGMGKLVRCLRASPSYSDGVATYQREAKRKRRSTVTPEQFRLVAYIALGALFVIVLTGAAVRLTDSGLGCPDWPRCHGKVLPPLSGHALIEFGNRALSGAVGVIAVAAAVLALLRRPFRRDLAVLAWLLPIGVLAQAVLGGYTVREHLAPGFVMGHFGLSMAILIAAVALAWRAGHEPGSRPRSVDRLSVWTVRALVPIGALAIFAGTAATAAGPHSGGAVGQRIHRLYFKGADTLTWVVHRHATIAALFGVIAIGVWLLHRRRGAGERVLEPLTVLCVLLAAEGLVGTVQYELKLPADMVWVHVMLATSIWVTVLWTAAAAGRLAPRTVPAFAEDTAPTSRGLETAGRTG